MNMFLTIIIMTVSFAFLAFVLAYILSSAVTADRRATEKRLTQLKKKNDTDVPLIKNESRATRKKRERKKASRTSGMFERFGSTVYKELQSADINMRPEEYMTIWLILALVPSSLAALFFSQKIIISIILLVIGLVAPALLIKNKQKGRVKAFEAQLGDALVVAGNCLRSGLTFQQAMETISQDMDAPIGTEFARVLSEMNLGSSMDDALEGLSDRIKSDDLKLMVSAVLIQRQTGGNLSEILDMISDKIKERMKMRQEVHTISSQGRMTGTIVGIMPIAIGGLFCLVDYDYMRVYFEEPRGNVVLIVAAVMEGLAFLIIKKIVSIKV